MEKIYSSMGPVTGQSTDATLVAVLDGHTFRVTIHWDRSYTFQTRGELAVLDGLEFKTVLHLHHQDVPRLAAYDLSEPVRKGEFERAGKLPGLVRAQLEALVTLGSKILGTPDPFIR